MLKIKVHVPKNEVIFNGTSYGRVSDTASKGVVIEKLRLAMESCGKGEGFPKSPVASHDGKNWIVTDQACFYCGSELAESWECPRCGSV